MPGMGGMAPALFAWGGGIAALLIGILWPGMMLKQVKYSGLADGESGDDG